MTNQTLVASGVLVTPLLLWFLQLLWMSEYVTIPATLLFPYASMEMFVEKQLRPPDSLGAPTLPGLLLACIQFPIYGWLIGKALIVQKLKPQIVRLALCHFGFGAMTLFTYFAERM